MEVICGVKAHTGSALRKWHAYDTLCVVCEREEQAEKAQRVVYMLRMVADRPEPSGRVRE